MRPKAGVCKECGKDIKLEYDYCYRHRYLDNRVNEKYGQGNRYDWMDN